MYNNLLIIIRHGEANNKCLSTLPSQLIRTPESRLTDSGLKHTLKLSRFFENDSSLRNYFQKNQYPLYNNVLFLTSPTLRTIQTSHFLFQHFSQTILAHPLMYELGGPLNKDYYSLQIKHCGLSKLQMNINFPNIDARYINDLGWWFKKDFENPIEAWKRIRQIAAYFNRMLKKQSVLLVGHLWLANGIRRYLEGRDFNEHWWTDDWMPLDNLNIATWEKTNDRYKLTNWNVSLLK